MPFVIGSFAVALVVWLVVWTVALFAGIALARRLLVRLGEPEEPPPDQAGHPGTPGRALPRLRPLRAVGIVVGTGFVNISVVVATSHGLGLESPRAALLALPVLYLIASGVLAGALPTTFSRACIAVFFQYIVAGVFWAGLYAGLVVLLVRNLDARMP